MTLDLAGVCTGPGPCDTASFGAGKNWVNKVGGLPDYIRAVAHAFTRKGLPESQAIERAVGVVRNWAEGRGGVTAATKARAVAAIAEWESKKTAAHSLTASAVRTVDLAMSPAQRASADRETAAIHERAATATFPHKFVAAQWTHPNGHPRCKNCGQEESIGGVCTKPTDKPTAGPATSIPLTASPSKWMHDLAWNEALHPRKGGKFAPKGTPATTTSANSLPANMAGNVRDFQKRTGLPVTGVIDTATAAKIRALTTPKTGRKGRKGTAAKARAAQRRVLGQQVSRANSLSSSQRSQLRQRMPVPPTGYVWTATNNLRAVPLTRSQQAAPLAGL